MADGDEQAPTTPREYFERGTSRLQDNDPQGAIADLQQAALLEGSTRPSVAVNMAYAYLAERQPDYALEQLRWLIPQLGVDERQRLALWLYYKASEGTYDDVVSHYGSWQTVLSDL